MWLVPGARYQGAVIGGRVVVCGGSCPPLATFFFRLMVAFPLLPTHAPPFGAGLLSLAGGSYLRRSQRPPAAELGTRLLQ